jgi:hypothetical protein
MEQNGNITLQTERAEGNVNLPEKINGTEINNVTDCGAPDSNARIVGAEVAASDGISDERRAEREEYDRLIRTKFKDFYTEDTQRMINRRFRHYKALAEKYKVLEESFSSPAGAKRLTDDELFERIEASSGEISSQYPSFSLERSRGSEQFVALARVALEQGSISLSQAYKLAHFDEIIAAERERIEKEVEQRMTDRIKSNKARQYENAVQPRLRGVGINVRSLTRNERAELAKRAANGEKIGF